MPGLKVLVVDDDPSVCLFLNSAFTTLGNQCSSFESTTEAEDYARENRVELAMVDIYLGNTNGIDLVAKLRALNPECYHVVMTAHISVETAARSISEGAVEYVAKPLLVSDLEAVLQRAAEYRSRNRLSRHSVPRDELSSSKIVGRSPKMLEVYRAIARVAPSNAHVLITGPSGTGKELVARAIHDHSRRKNRAFTAVNCGALPETILESELFGHEKGSFTGADSVRKGLIEATDGGTLFLDEISETTLNFQVKLLRFIQEQQVRRVGSNRFTDVDVRVLAASNRDLRTEIAAGHFREDLFYRLSVVQIEMPSLEQRSDDIPLLAEHFLAHFNQRNGGNIQIEEAAVERLRSMQWPGNVRELENCVQRLAIFAASGLITASDVERYAPQPPLVRSSAAAAASNTEPSPQKLSDYEREHIRRILKETNGNRSEAARRLGIERKTLYKKARRLGIELDRPFA